jgi:5-methylcytosine-specific restriction endonuclease McrA
MKRRVAVMRRANWTCERCGERLAQEIHHLGSLSDNRLEMLIAVCRPCHRALEAEKRVGSGQH